MLVHVCKVKEVFTVNAKKKHINVVIDLCLALTVCSCMGLTHHIFMKYTYLNSFINLSNKIFHPFQIIDHFNSYVYIVFFFTARYTLCQDT